MARIGILGGCFNPVHHGHLRLAVEVRESLGLDRVKLMPAHVPPHKSAQGMLPFAMRLALAQAAVAGVPWLEVDDIESRREGPSYTVDTLRALRDESPGDELWFVLGAGDLFNLPQWHLGLEIPALCNLAVSGRGEDGAEAVSRFVTGQWTDSRASGQGGWLLPGGCEIRFVPLQRLDISASDIRSRWLAGRSVIGLVPLAVVESLEARRGEVDGAWKESS